jgi:uncharacterized protein (TIGR02145 family)
MSDNDRIILKWFLIDNAGEIFSGLFIIFLIIYFVLKNRRAEKLEEETLLYAAGIEHEEDNNSEVEINKQIWMKKNLNVSFFQNGDEILLCQSALEWKNASERKIPASCYYYFDESYGELYGKLYNWYAVNDLRCLAPKGWKIPSWDDYNDIDEYCGGEHESGFELKSRLGWKNNSGGRNSSGFTGYPSGMGYFEENTMIWCGLGEYAFFWSETEVSDDVAIHFALLDNASTILSGISKDAGCSVRCIKDFGVTSDKKLEKTNHNQANHQDDYKEKYIKMLEAEVERLKNEKKES